MEASNPEISIVVPMYNSSYFVKNCIESVLKQDFTNYELLLIDDHSTDETMEICKNYIQDKRIKLLCNEGKGVSSARNQGIMKSTGSYITFVDSDDVLEQTFLSKLLNIAKGNPRYLPMCGHVRFENGNPDFEVVDSSESNTVETNDLIANIFYYHPASWGCLFQSEVIKKYGIKMEESASFNEDIYFTVKYLCVCDGGIIIPDKLYGYRTNINGIGANKPHNTLTAKDVEHRAKGYYAFQDAIKFSEKNAPGKSVYIDIGYSFMAAEVLLTSVRAGIGEFDLKKKIKKYLSISHCIDFVRHGKNMYQKLLVCGVAINSHVIKYILDDMGLLKIIYSR